MTCKISCKNVWIHCFCLLANLINNQNFKKLTIFGGHWGGAKSQLQEMTPKASQILALAF